MENTPLITAFTHSLPGFTLMSIIFCLLTGFNKVMFIFFSFLFCFFACFRYHRAKVDGRRARGGRGGR